MLYKLILIVCFLLFIDRCFAQCGEERWDVKTLSDPDTSLINFDNIIKTTIHEQASLTKPLKIKRNLPRRSDETSVYSINCYILGFKREKDMDIHIVIKDLDSEETMVAELPSPWCPEVEETSRSKTFNKINEWFLNNIGKPGERYKTLRKPIPVSITGVGFFDFVHGQKGMAPNGREIHPVLNITLLDK
jgi:hypothetical protein